MPALPDFPIPDPSRPGTEESKGCVGATALSGAGASRTPRHSKLCAIDPMDCQWHSLR